jgi:hypothetical protein
VLETASPPLDDLLARVDAHIRLVPGNNGGVANPIDASDVATPVGAGIDPCEIGAAAAVRRT